MLAHSGSSCGTVEETIDALTSSKAQPRSSSRLRSAAPSSSAVDWRTVAKRQCSSSCCSRYTPKCVCVLPTSTASSIAGDYAPREMSEHRPRLYVVPASHPCAAVEAALELKGIAYARTVLLPIAPVLAGPLRWGGTTVPGMRLGSERLVGSRTIMRRLDTLSPEPPLLPPPSDPAHARVLEAERWGDAVFQSLPRRLIDAAFLRRPAAMESYAEGQKLPLPTAMLRPALPLTARLMARKNDATDESARADAAALPGHLDRVDGWIA